MASNQSPKEYGMIHIPQDKKQQHKQYKNIAKTT